MADVAGGPIANFRPGIYLWNPITNANAQYSVSIFDRYAYNHDGPDENQLLSAKLSTKVNTGGTLTIKVPPNNKNLQWVIDNWDTVFPGVGLAPMNTNFRCLAQWIRCIVVLPNGKTWFGRPEIMEYDQNGISEITFEGCLSLLTDFIVDHYDYQEYYKDQDPEEVHGGISIKDFVKVMIERADSQVAGKTNSDYRRVFQTVDSQAANERVYPVSDSFQTIYDALMDGVTELSRGYFDSSFEYHDDNARYYQYVYFKYYTEFKNGLTLPRDSLKSLSKGVDFTNNTWLRLAPFGSKLDNSERRVDITSVAESSIHPSGSIWVSSNADMADPMNSFIKDIVTVAEIFDGVTEPEILYKLGRQIVANNYLRNATKKFSMNCVGFYRQVYNGGIPYSENPLVQQGDIQIGKYYQAEDMKGKLDCISAEYDLLNPANDSYEFEEHI